MTGNMKAVDLSAITPKDIIYTGILDEEIILSGNIPFQFLLENKADKKDEITLTSESNLNFVKKCLCLKTDPDIVEKAMNIFTLDHLKKINEDITEIVNGSAEKKKI